MDQRWIEERIQALRMEIQRLIAEGEDEEGLRLRPLLAELERWEAVRWEAGARIAAPRTGISPNG